MIFMMLKFVMRTWLISFTFSDYIHTLDVILNCLEQNGFKVSPIICKQAIQEKHWLMYLLKPTGLRQWPKKLLLLLLCKFQLILNKFVLSWVPLLTILICDHAILMS